MPLLTIPLSLPKDVACHLTAGPFSSEAVLRPLSQVLLVEGHVKLQRTTTTSRSTLTPSVQVPPLATSTYRFSEVVKVYTVEVEQVLTSEPPDGGHARAAELSRALQLSHRQC